LLQYDDDIAFGALIEGLASSDTWISTSAAENVGRFTAKRADELKPTLIAAGSATKPVWLRNLVLTPLVTLSPETAIEVATSLARSGVAAARSSAVTALGRLGDAGRARLEELNSDPALKGLLPAPGGRGGGGGGGARPTPTPRSEAEYRALVEKWIVPAYNGKANPRAIWETPRGKIELELHPGDSPLGAEYFVQSIASGDIVGTEFTRVVPNFVAQQASIRNAPLLRDETNRGGLLRGTLAWATAGLDTGRPGYTLGTTPQPHNESNYTSLGRVVSGMDVVDMLEWGDRILAARKK
jgi:peptidyl-prolyl cis-trans isomerase B (cyclophilin B)